MRLEVGMCEQAGVTNLYGGHDHGVLPRWHNGGNCGVHSMLDDGGNVSEYALHAVHDGEINSTTLHDRL